MCCFVDRIIESMNNLFGTIIALASIVALVGLILLQYNWMRKSRELIEEQFDQKVNLALCDAVQKASQEPNCKAVATTCAITNTTNCSSQLEDLWQTTSFKNALQNSLDFYSINLPYEIQIINKEDYFFSMLPAGCCPLKPIVNNNDHYLSIVFPTKEQYFFRQLGLMLISSIVILVVITALFLIINYRLVVQKRIMKANKTFFNSMAHEFRTPLTNINLATTLIPKKWPEAHDNKYLNIIQKESDQLMNQVNQLLDFAKMEQGQFPLQKKPIHIQQLINQVIETFEPQIQAKGATINVKVPSSPTYIKGDELHIKNAFRNLLDNALKHHPDQPNIEILVNQQGDGINIEFKDDGNGIPPQDQAFIFDQFYRSNPNDSKSYKGFGIGLAYVKQIITLHSGSIEVFTKPDKGTKFTLFFPAT